MKSAAEPYIAGQDDAWLSVWAHYIGCLPTALFEPRVLLIPRPQGDEAMVAVVDFGAAQLVEYSPLAINDMPGVLLRGALIPPLDMAALMPRYQPDEGEDTLLSLAPAAFTPCAPPEGYTLHTLGGVHAQELSALEAAVGQEQAGDAFVRVTHDLAVGCRREGQLVAAASLMDWRGFADPGVLTHPLHRGLGLGKVVVSQLIIAALASKRVPIYRCRNTLAHSRRIAQALGFVPRASMRAYRKRAQG